MTESSSSWWEQLIETKLLEIEKQLNPEGIPYPPPDRWPPNVLEHLLTETYRRETPDTAPPYPPPGVAISRLGEELNRIFNGRITHDEPKTPPPPQLVSWLGENFPAGGAWNPVDVVEADGASRVDVARAMPEVQKVGGPSSSGQIPKESYQKSDDTTLRSGSTIVTNVVIGTQPTQANTPPGRPSRGESESSHSPKRAIRGRNTRAGTRRQVPEQAKRARHPCPQCPKTFPFPSKLRDHMHIHEETKEFICGIGLCTKAFKRQRELQAHIKTHPENSIQGAQGRDEEMHDDANQSPELPDPNKSLRVDRSPTKSPPARETHQVDRRSTPPRIPPHITHETLSISKTTVLTPSDDSPRGDPPGLSQTLLEPLPSGMSQAIPTEQGKKQEDERQIIRGEEAEDLVTNCVADSMR